MKLLAGICGVFIFLEDRTAIAMRDCQTKPNGWFGYGVRPKRNDYIKAEADGEARREREVSTSSSAMDIHFSQESKDLLV
ncbi:hypothetical protein F5Y16DRAFT_382651 [Xylariaceae sp. FL0255]|nr:hypothetical protein F5Y16DRAFT_382651 [Xylariaceae sp. FL0255]